MACVSKTDYKRTLRESPPEIFHTQHLQKTLILADAHNLSTGSRRRPLLSDFYALVSFLKSGGMPVNTTVLFTGEHDVLEPLIMQDTWLIRRFSALL